MADILRAAAEHVETHGVTNPLCDHDWQVDRQRTRLERTQGEVIVLYDRCTKCRGERDREIYPGDPGYDEAKRLADGPKWTCERPPATYAFETATAAEACTVKTRKSVFTNS